MLCDARKEFPFLIISLILSFLLPCCDGSMSVYKWDVTFYEESGTSRVFTVLDNTNYMIGAGLTRVASYISTVGVVEYSELAYDLNMELSALGMFPQFNYKDQVGIAEGSLNRTWENSTDAFSLDEKLWKIPVTTGEASIVEITVKSNNVMLPGMTIWDTPITFSVLPRFFHNLSYIINSTLTPAASSKIIIPEFLSLSYIPSVSTLWLTSMPHEDSSKLILAYTQSEYELTSFVEVTDDVVMGDIICEEGNYTTRSLILPHRMIISTHSGFFVSTHNTTHSWMERGVRGCVLEFTASTQKQPNNETFNDLLLVYQRSSSGPVVFRSTTKSDPFRELMDADGLSLVGFYEGKVADMTKAVVQYGGISAADPTRYLFLLDYQSSTDDSAELAVASTTPNYLLLRYTSGEEIFFEDIDLPVAAWDARPLFSFPSYVANRNSTTEQVVTLMSVSDWTEDEYYSRFLEGQELVEVDIRGMEFGRSISLDLFIWGSVVLYSPDGGNAFVVLQALPDHPARVFTTSLSGSFAFLTNNYEVWFGTPAATQCVQIVGARVKEASVGRSVFFDTSNALVELIARKENDESIIERENTLTLVTPSEISRFAVVNSLICPFESIFVTADHSPSWTRQSYDGGERAASGKLPKSLYFDRNGSYNFTVDIFPSSLYTTDDIEASITIHALRSLAYDITRIDHGVLGYLSFEVMLWETGDARAQLPPGESLQVSEMRFVVENMTVGCYTWDGLTSGEYTDNAYPSVELYVGCPPYQQIVFEPTLSHVSFTAKSDDEVDPDPEEDTWTHESSGFDDICLDEYMKECDDCCDRVRVDSGELRCSWASVIENRCVSTFYYAYDFHPWFAIYDSVTKELTNYTGNYFLEIVGGGRSLSDLTQYTSDDIRNYNYKVCSGCGLASVYTHTYGSSSSDHMTECGHTCETSDECDCEKNAEWSWVCSPGSPCNMVWPVWPDPPVFYWNLSFTTADANDTSYCEHSFSFLIKVHGIPMDFVTTVSITATSLGFFFFILIFGFAWIENKKRMLRRKVVPLERLQSVFSEKSHRLLRRFPTFAEPPTQGHTDEHAQVSKGARGRRPSYVF